MPSQGVLPELLPPFPVPLRLLTFVVERTVEVVAAGVEAGGQLDEVASPRVAGTWEAGQSDELLGLGWKEPSVHAAVVCKGQGTDRGQWQGHSRRSLFRRDQGVSPIPATSQLCDPVLLGPVSSFGNGKMVI